MTLGARIARRLQDLEWSQSELARRTKLPQTTINSLIRAGRRSSPYLNKIARELGTTVAYLTCETDDPDEDAPPVPDLTSDERELLDHYRVLTPADRAALLHIAKAMTGQGGEPKAFARTIHAPRREYHGEDSG